ncbi:hypothetical protein ACFW6N_06795 [Streptomyces cyaneofuscatus]|uniref:hypothetical protein n=1 Tax=Streptomyces cyaneofuscatus TaxID=66883 RepID=UPI000AFCFD22|nr:hypothetical protein [Streptomyces cyaneofuscatus]
MEDIIAAKADGKPLPSPDDGKENKAGEVVDLMAALNASVKAAKESRGEDHNGEDATVHEMRPAKKTSGRTAPAKKKAASSKTTTAKNTTASSSSRAKKRTGKKAAAKKRTAS